ncbi:MAG TPA: hypothetical protein VHN20_10600 [Beijerinckiaceae bacterium]|nr:hypothetical protein [Beijerinckiaceae bacterium]
MADDALKSITPTLQAVDKADLDAVRGFLPGKLLGRTAAFLALGVLVLAQMGALDLALRHLFGISFDPAGPWAKFGVLAALPALVVVVQLALEARARAQARRIRQRTVATAGVRERHFRVGPYGSADQAAFDRADKVHETVLGWIMAPDLRVPLYLSGDSGTGKSSLLAAYVVPKLRQAGWVIVQARAHDDPQAQLRDALVALSPSRPRTPARPEDMPLRAQLEAAARHVRGPGRLLVLLDQFEEFVILHAPAARESFSALLRDLAAQSIPGLVLLLVVRSEYEAHLQELGLPPLRLGENLQKVPRFTLGAARRFLDEGGIGLAPETVDGLVSGAARLDDTPGLVRPITINLVGYVLAEGARIRPEAIDAGRLILRYVQDVIQHPDVRHLMPQLLPQLITEAGTKAPATIADLASRSGLSVAEVRACLLTLAQHALARPLDERQETWELSHDFVARLVGQALGRLHANVVGRVLSYTAPILLLLMLVGVAGLGAWLITAEDRARANLQHAGLHLMEDGAGGIALLATSVKPERVPLAVSGTRHFAGRITELVLSELSGWLLQCDDCFPLVRRVSLISLESPDLAQLAKLESLKTLNLVGGSAPDVTSLRALANLEELGLVNVQLSDLATIADLKALRYLALSKNPVSDLTPLRGLNALAVLRLNETQVSDLGPLAELFALEDLSLAMTAVSNITPLRRLTALKRLDLTSTNVRDLTPLQQDRITIVHSLVRGELQLPPNAAHWDLQGPE